jgi:hypothetical protein
MMMKTEEGSAKEPLFQDTSVDCAICLLPLDDDDDDDDNDGNSAKESNRSNHQKVVITLTCGHRWHSSCLREQLEHAKPNPAKRLVFTGCTCAKCAVVCSDHPSLRHVSRKVDSLRQRVEILIREQLEIDKDDEDEDEDEDYEDGNSNKAAKTTKEERMERAWRKYAFYLCANCQEPYFGGTIECADQVDGEILAAKDRLCVACSASNADCRNRTQHRSFLVWKCRFCCQPSRYVCYGKVHFCDSCHARNTRRVQEARQRRQPGVSSSSSKPAPLEPIPCPGGATCPFPKPDGRYRHVNSPTSDGEQVYGCTLCQSGARNGTSTSSRWDIPEGSRNLIVNSSGQDGLRGWQQLNLGNPSRRSMAWRVEASDLPAIPAVAGRQPPEGQQDPPPPLSSNFVSSFSWCSMAQTVPLHRHVRDPSQARIEVAAQHRGRTDCPSVFRLEAAVLNRQGRPIHRVATEVLNTPQDDWDRASLILDPVAGAHSVVLSVHGKDGRFWQGIFGAKVADCSVRILGSPEIMQEELLLVDAGALVDDGGLRRQQEGHQVQRNPDPWNLLFQQAVLPIVCFFLFFWLVRD